ncbi:hypothetical protein C0J52_20781 [Blattella germanica]|nr:hypothetical protein C0J52_20781 [Blattella germanica]
MDSDQENKAKTRWDTVQSMAEAKSALKHLFDLVADMKRNVLSKEAKCEELEIQKKSELLTLWLKLTGVCKHENSESQECSDID